jgi:hypothetical protein
VAPGVDEHVAGAGAGEARAQPCDVAFHGAFADLSDYVARHGISREEATAWANDLFERAELGEYFFSFSRYVVTTRKP